MLFNIFDQYKNNIMSNFKNLSFFGIFNNLKSTEKNKNASLPPQTSSLSNENSILVIDDKIFKEDTYKSELSNFNVTRDKIIELFAWFYNPNTRSNFKNIDEIINFAVTLGIPRKLIDAKTLEYTCNFYSNDTFNSKEIEGIKYYANNYKQQKLTYGYYYGSSSGSGSGYGNARTYNYNSYNEEEIKKKAEEQHEKNKHSFYPLPSPTQGQPRLDWCKCAHYGCDKKFPSVTKFIKHLEEMHSFTPGYHLDHETSLDNKSDVWTPDYVINNNITKCPSYFCTKVIKTPKELVKHLTVLGMKNFYNGQTAKELIFELSEGNIDLDKKDETTTNHTTTNHTTNHTTTTVADIYKEHNIYTNDECAICFENIPQVIYVPCMHHLICFECSMKYKDICMMCRKKIDYIIPF